MTVAGKKITVTGVVQGVGFRPFVYRIATELGLAGTVSNNGRGVTITVEGEDEAVTSFEAELASHPPPLAHILSVASRDTPPEGHKKFSIEKSEEGSEKTALISPDCDVCEDCLRELFDPDDRRYRYPFINCTNCGPRFSIIEDIPYDRPKTTMKKFPMCGDCKREYDDPADRRFHAQPVACPVCGPEVTLRDSLFNPLETIDAIEETARLLANGAIVAIKGIGGYHLAADANNSDAVKRLREKKRRDRKPFALMVADIKAARRIATISEREEARLKDVAHPIVLAAKISDVQYPGVAPGNRRFGLFLPYTPIHHMLFDAGGFDAVVMTSANVTDDPIVHTEEDARSRLCDIAEYFLTHNRRIEHRSDDSIELFMSHGPVVLRRSRGYTPAPVMLEKKYPPTLAIGSDLKNTFCFIKEERAFVSQHIGDLVYEKSFSYLASSLDRFLKLIDADKPRIVAFDAHPDSAAAAMAKERFGDIELTPVFHHHAHLASVLTENGISDNNNLGVIFDGTGYGEDGTIWGGEFLLGGVEGYKRVGATAPLPLPGGDAAIREPWRIAIAVLDRLYGAALPPLDLDWLKFIPAEKKAMIVAMTRAKINTPISHGVGRLFDTASALAGLCHEVAYEGEAAMALEAAVARGVERDYPYRIEKGGDMMILDFTPAFLALTEDMAGQVSVSEIAARFHNTVARGAFDMIMALKEKHGFDRVAFSGGVFQNQVLSGKLGDLIENSGNKVLRHSRIPPNDGGISLGQAVIAAVRSRKYVGV